VSTTSTRPRRDRRGLLTFLPRTRRAPPLLSDGRPDRSCDASCATSPPVSTQIYTCVAPPPPPPPPQHHTTPPNHHPHHTPPPHRPPAHPPPTPHPHTHQPTTPNHRTKLTPTSTPPHQTPTPHLLHPPPRSLPPPPPPLHPSSPNPHTPPTTHPTATPHTPHTHDTTPAPPAHPTYHPPPYPPSHPFVPLAHPPGTPPSPPSNAVWTVCAQPPTAPFTSPPTHPLPPPPDTSTPPLHLPTPCSYSPTLSLPRNSLVRRGSAPISPPRGQGSPSVRSRPRTTPPPTLSERHAHSQRRGTNTPPTMPLTTNYPQSLCTWPPRTAQSPHRHSLPGDPASALVLPNTETDKLTIPGPTTQPTGPPSPNPGLQLATEDNNDVSFLFTNLPALTFRNVSASPLPPPFPYAHALYLRPPGTSGLAHLYHLSLNAPNPPYAPTSWPCLPHFRHLTPLLPTLLSPPSNALIQGPSDTPHSLPRFTALPYYPGLMTPAPPPQFFQIHTKTGPALPGPRPLFR